MIHSVIEAPAASSATVETLKEATRSARSARAAKPKAARKEKAKIESAVVAEIIAAARVVCVSVKEFGTNPLRPSYVFRLPKWSALKETLPQGEEGKAIAKTFHALRGAVEALAGDSSATWVLHTSGSFALYSKFAR